MQHIHTLFEHETQTCQLDDRQLALLDQLQQRLPEKVLQPVYRAGGWALRASQYVGVIRVGNATIQILPKIYQSSSSAPIEVRAREATANLLHMLAYAGFIQVRESDQANLLRQESDWFELLTYLFATHLRDEWRRGPVRSYITIEDELPLLKGKWRLDVQLRRPERKHRFAVAYDEYTVDIPLNRIFRFVVERLSRLTRSSVNARMLGELRALLDDVTLLPVASTADADRVAFSRLTARYEPLLNLARLFLDGGALQTASGDTRLFAFVFDMNAVFEGFIAGFLHRHRLIALPPELQGSALAVQARGKQLHLAVTANQPVFRLKPDLLFHQNNQTMLIADTKYKRLHVTERKLGISEADFYQMFAYARRYACPHVVLLYPQHAEMGTGIERLFQLHDGEHTVLAATVNLSHDLGKRSAKESLAAELAHILTKR